VVARCDRIRDEANQYAARLAAELRDRLAAARPGVESEIRASANAFLAHLGQHGQRLVSIPLDDPQVRIVAGISGGTY
jgi:hypothetical protein